MPSAHSLAFFPLGTPGSSLAFFKNPPHSRISHCLAVALFLCLFFPFTLRADNPPLSRQDQAWLEAEELYNRRRWPQAERAYFEFRRDYGLDERSLEALYRIGVCRQRRRNHDGAISAWRDVLRSPVNRPAERAVLKKGLGDLFKILDPERDRYERDQILGRLAREFPDDKDTTVQIHAAEGRRRFEAGEFSAAVRLFTVVEPHLSELNLQYLQLARMHAGRGRLSPALIMQLADKSQESSQPEAAIPLYELALRSGPSTAEEIELRTKYGWSQYLDGNHADAEDQWRQVIEHTRPGDPWRGRSRWHLAVLHAGHKRDTQTAIALCEEQASEFRGHQLGEQALFSNAWLLMISEQWQPALDSFRQLVTDYPHSADNPYIRSYIERCEKILGKAKER